MGLLKRIVGLFTAPTPTSPRGNFYLFQVRCQRCGELIEGRVNLNNDLSYEDAEGGEGAAATLFSRKVLVGNNSRCFQPIEVLLRFDADRKLLDKQISGGSFVE